MLLVVSVCLSVCVLSVLSYVPLPYNVSAIAKEEWSGVTTAFRQVLV